MFKGSLSRGKVLALAVALGWGAALPASAQHSELRLAAPEVVEQRLDRAVSRNQERQQRLAAMLQEAGCAGERLTLQRVRRARLPNVICTLAGESEAVIVVGAHYDMAGRGQGVADNWSGAALLASLAETLLAAPRRHTFVLVGFAEEESGLRGSQGYVAALSREQKAAIRAMVNLDTLGLATSKVWLNRADPRLAAKLEQTATALEHPLQGVNFERGFTTDSESFRKAGIPAITIHSITQETAAILHSERDTRAAVDLGDYYETYRLVAAYLELLDERLAQPVAQPVAAGAAE
jgi:Zn-dependent M28 family amino/carboxypeptidase